MYLTLCSTCSSSSLCGALLLQDNTLFHKLLLEPNMKISLFCFFKMTQWASSESLQATVSWSWCVFLTNRDQKQQHWVLVIFYMKTFTAPSMRTDSHADKKNTVNSYLFITICKHVCAFVCILSMNNLYSFYTLCLIT